MEGPPVQVLTAAPAGIEHAVAYAGTALIMALAYPSWPVWMICASLAAYSGLMELLQNFSPGRHPGLDGVLWSSSGAMLGGDAIDGSVKSNGRNGASTSCQLHSIQSTPA